MELLIENEVEKAITISASSVDVLFPVSNIYARRLSELYKSESITGAATLDIDIELEVAGVFNRMTIINHNIAAGDTVQIYYDSGSGWTLLEAVTGAEDEQYFYHQMAAIPVGTTDLRLKLTAGITKVFSIGWLYFGNALALTGPVFGSTPRLLDTNNESLSWSRQLFVDEGLAYRTQRLQFDCGSVTEFNNLLAYWQDSTLRGQPGLFVQFEDDPYALLEPYFAKGTIAVQERVYGGVYPYRLTLEEVF